MTRTALARKFNVEQLVARAAAIEAAPTNQQTGSVYRFTPSARKHLDAIAWAISYHLAVRRKSEAAS